MPLDTTPDREAFVSPAGDHGFRGQPCGACPPARWHVVATEWQAEAQAQRAINDLDPCFDARLFLVAEREPGTRLRPSRTKIRPAFPGYLIVRWAEGDPWRRIRKDSRLGIAGVLHAVGQPDVPAVLPDVAMAALLDRVDPASGYLDAAEPEAPEDLTGAQVEVAAGWLAGLRGLCRRSGAERAVVLLSMLGGEREVVVPRASVFRVA